MLALTHLLLALLLIRLFDLDRQAAFTTLLFGVFIDLDHLFGMVDFVAREGWGNALNVNAALSSDVQWKSLLHSPEGVLFVGPVVLMTGALIPLLAWGLHQVMDHVQIYYLGVASWAEMALLAVLVFSYLALDRAEHRHTTGDSSWTGLIRWECGRIISFVLSLPVLRSVRRWRGPRGTSG